MKLSYLLMIIVLLMFSSVYSQIITSTSHFKIGGDLVSQYVWRGSMATKSPTPNFQPFFSYSNGPFETGVWGSSDFLGSYKEVDPYVCFTVNQLRFTVSDYNWNFNRADYFNYRNKQTGHRIEGSIGFNGSKDLPVTITWNTLFYGFDEKSNDTTKQAYSTYVELGYLKGPVSFFLGLTPWASYYNNYGITAFDPKAPKRSFSVVNIGASYKKNLKITEIYSLPLKTTLVINPTASYSRNDYIHLVFGISL